MILNRRDFAKKAAALFGLVGVGNVVMASPAKAKNLHEKFVFLNGKVVHAVTDVNAEEGWVECRKIIWTSGSYRGSYRFDYIDNFKAYGDVKVLRWSKSLHDYAMSLYESGDVVFGGLTTIWDGPSEYCRLSCKLRSIQAKIQRERS